MTLNVSTDAAKLPAALADRYVEGLATRLGARVEQTTTFVPEPAVGPGGPGGSRGTS
jgi:hypothetical protein